MARVLITGASRGLGAAFARIAHDAGHEVFLVARDQGDLEALAAELGSRAAVLVCDLADGAALDAMWRDAGRVDVLINNAGLGGSGDFAASDWDRERAMLDVNLLAATRLAKLAMGQMIPRGDGRILNVASLAGYLPGPNMAIYFATKAYLRSLSEALWQEARGRGVTVTALCPGPVDTAFFDAGGLRGGRDMMDAATVAQAGWDGMMRGRRMVIPGVGPKAIAIAATHLPRRLALAIAAKALNHRPR
ncbi:putative oxidoreductase [Rhodobacteraceae bacterium THAF1]|uniref:SDR family NAD(P)-dependent oxidoreductase n=1 Tax=Palleronia sp. THAF1 TaxID=2587842 RepID=UPI000F3E8B42|nr:SDR family oxidoreductase [Palleronia sp. THAF1]QFU08274.1 putative oxidoreductase [Palleronia sp. THAF1]VDC28859.1 putative oxidoreductase [Rhodobacteraceae bacterium THAF1]